MMNLRTLKKRSQEAASILEKHYGAKTFLAERGENYHGLKVRCHCTRNRKRKPRTCDHQDHPLKGTPMVGEVSGYYEPEWSERTAYEQLHEAVLFSSRARSMSDAEWAEAMKVTGVTAEDQKRIDEWVNASDPDCGVYAQPASSTPSTGDDA